MSTQLNIEANVRHNRRKWYGWPKLLRQGVMLFFFLFPLHVAYDHQAKGGGPRGTPSVEAYCLFGGLETLYQFLTTGGFVRRIEPSALILFAALVLLSLLASRGFCGWMCPFGSVQEWIGLLGRKMLEEAFQPDRHLGPAPPLSEVRHLGDHHRVDVAYRRACLSRR